jgi:hypothetical protein
MNDRGARLTPVDLLKSFLLSGVGDDGRDKLNESWRFMIADLTVTRNDSDAPRIFLKAALTAHYANSKIPHAIHRRSTQACTYGSNATATG